MNLTMRQKMIILVVLSVTFLILIAINFAFLDVSTIPKQRTDPESGIYNWMGAMNTRDYARLYAISPSGIKQNISFNDFRSVNEDNIFFRDNVTFIDFQVLNKTSTGNIISIEAALEASKADYLTKNVSNFVIFYGFDESYENNEWKVWARAP